MSSSICSKTHPEDEQGRITDSQGQSHSKNACMHTYMDRHLPFPHTDSNRGREEEGQKVDQNKVLFSRNMKIPHIWPDGCNLYLFKMSLAICDSSYRDLEANKYCPRVLLSVRIRVKPLCKVCVAFPCAVMIV